MVCNVNATPAASQRRHQLVCVSIDGIGWDQLQVQTHAMEGKINIAVAICIGRTGVEPER